MDEESSFVPAGTGASSSSVPPGLRRGLHSFAASPLGARHVRNMPSGLEIVVSDQWAGVSEIKINFKIKIPTSAAENAAEMGHPFSFLSLVPGGVPRCFVLLVLSVSTELYTHYRLPTIVMTLCSCRNIPRESWNW